jgi:hypothetical protein
MPTLTDWFTLYTAQKNAITSLNAAVTGVQGAIAIQINNALFDINATLLTLKSPATTGGGTTVAIDLTPTNTILANSLGNVVPRLTQIAGDLSNIDARLVNLVYGTAVGIELAIQGIASSVATIAGKAGGGGTVDVSSLVNELKSLDAGTLTGIEFAIQQIGNNLVTLDAGTLTGIELAIERMAAAIEGGAGVGGAGAPHLDDAMVSLKTVLDALTATASPSWLEDVRSAVKRFDSWIESIPAISWLVPSPGGIQGDMRRIGAGLVYGIQTANEVLSPLHAPFTALVAQATTDLLKALTDGGKATVNTAIPTAQAALTVAAELGIDAHILAIAAEAVLPFKHMGIGAAAAAIVDIAGFKPLSQAVMGHMVEGAISRPMHFWANSVFTPEILMHGELALLLRKRIVSEENFVHDLAFQGYDQGTADLLLQGAYRDPRIYDLGIILEDATVAEDWLYSRVQRSGYTDEDARVITSALLQRMQKTTRVKVVSAANSAFAAGVISAADHDTILTGLGMRPEVVALEQQVAQLDYQRSYAALAITTYRRQYTNDVITRDDFATALSLLGLDPARAQLELADAAAARAPRIAAKEAAAIQKTVREIQRYLIPRYRQLFYMGLVTSADYETELITAGIDPVVAAQAVSLDALKVQAITQNKATLATARVTSQVLTEQERLYAEQFRKGVIDQTGLTAALQSLHLTPTRVQTIVQTEIVGAIPPVPYKVTAPPEAAAALAKGMEIEAALLDFRRGRIDATVLYTKLIANGIAPAQAHAKVDVEIARKP